MIVHFIGAGPGAADLITVRGRDLIAQCPVCLYAGSIVPKELLQYCPPGARIVDTAPMSLDEIDPELADRVAAYRAGYLAEERRDIERMLDDGTLLGVATTNALGDQRVVFAFFFQQGCGLAGDARTCGTQRVAKRDGTTIKVDL